MSPFSFVPAPLVGGFSSVAICTPNDAFIYFIQNVVPFTGRSDHQRDSFDLLPLVVKLQNNRVSFPAINAKFISQPFPKKPSVLFPSRLLPLTNRASVLVAVVKSVAQFAIGLSAVRFACVIIELGYRFNDGAFAAQLGTQFGGNHERVV